MQSLYNTIFYNITRYICSGKLTSVRWWTMQNYDIARVLMDGFRNYYNILLIVYGN